MNKLFSIIIIYYNSEKYVAESIESVLNQTEDDFELILVNDGSTDKTAYLCDLYKKKDPRIVVINKQNGGIASARNAGINCATGEYFLLLDGDDYISTDSLANFRELIEQSGHKADYIFGKMIYFNDETNEPYAKQNSLEKDIVKGMTGQTAFCAMLETDGAIKMGVRGAFKRSFVNRYNITFIDRYYEDVHYIMQILTKADYVMVNTKDHYFFRDRMDSTSKRISLKHFADIIKEMYWWEETYTNDNFDSRDFVEAVKKEKERRIKAAIRKYVSFLDVRELLQLCWILKGYEKIADFSQLYHYKICKNTIGVYVMRIVWRTEESIHSAYRIIKMNCKSKGMR